MLIAPDLLAMVLAATSPATSWIPDNIVQGVEQAKPYGGKRDGADDYNGSAKPPKAPPLLRSHLQDNDSQEREDRPHSDGKDAEAPKDKNWWHDSGWVQAAGGIASAVIALVATIVGIVTASITRGMRRDAILAQSAFLAASAPREALEGTHIGFVNAGSTSCTILLSVVRCFPFGQSHRFTCDGGIVSYGVHVGANGGRFDVAVPPFSDRDRYYIAGFAVSRSVFGEYRFNTLEFIVNPMTGEWHRTEGDIDFAQGRKIFDIMRKGREIPADLFDG